MTTKDRREHAAPQFSVSNFSLFSNRLNNFTFFLCVCLCALVPWAAGGTCWRADHGLVNLTRSSVGVLQRLKGWYGAINKKNAMPRTSALGTSKIKKEQSSEKGN